MEEVLSTDKGKEIISFNEIFDSEHYVICDYSINGTEGTCWFHDSVYDVHRFSQLDFMPMQKQIETSNIFLNVLNNPKAIVTKGVSLEILTSMNLLSDKVNFLSNREKTNNKNKDRKGRLEENCPVEKAILDETNGLFRDIYVQSRRKRFFPKQKSLYEFLERIVISVADKTHAKIDFGSRYRREKSDRFEDFHTDEQLVATALYLSTFENQKGCILTRDSDIRRILTSTMTFLSYQNNTIFQEIFESSKKNRIGIYYMEGLAKSRLEFDSSLFLKEKGITIPQKDLREISKEIEPYNPFK